MPGEEPIEVMGRVIEALPNAMYKVELENGDKVVAHVPGEMKKYFVRVLPGDRIRVELAPTDLSRGRIVYRYR